MDAPAHNTGDPVLFSGSGWVSRSIRWRTWSPYSHCGLVCWVTPDDIHDVALLSSPSWIDRADYICDWLGLGKWLIIESTTQAGLPCAITGEYCQGVQAHELQVRVDRYDGPVYVLPFRDEYRFPGDDDAKLPLNLLTRIGTPYDPAGAGLLGSCVLKHVWPHDASDRSSVFCSEFVARQLSYLPGSRIPISSPSRWTPGGLYRTLTKTERVSRPVKIPKTKGT
jgi:hypothetical protein